MVHRGTLPGAPVQSQAGAAASSAAGLLAEVAVSKLQGSTEREDRLSDRPPPRMAACNTAASSALGRNTTTQSLAAPRDVKPPTFCSPALLTLPTPGTTLKSGSMPSSISLVMTWHTV